MIKTVTFDDATHKIVPIEPTEKQYVEAQKMLEFSDEYCHNYFAKDFTEGDLYKAMIAAAPEYVSAQPEYKSIQPEYKGIEE